MVGFIFMCWLSPASAAGSRTRVRSWRFQPTTIWFSQFRNVGGSHWKITSGICSGNPSLVKERQIIYISIPLYTLTNTCCILLFALTKEKEASEGEKTILP